MPFEPYSSDGRVDLRRLGYFLLGGAGICFLTGVAYSLFTMTYACMLMMPVVMPFLFVLPPLGYVTITRMAIRETARASHNRNALVYWLGAGWCAACGLFGVWLAYSFVLSRHLTLPAGGGAWWTPAGMVNLGKLAAEQGGIYGMMLRKENQAAEPIRPMLIMWLIEAAGLLLSPIVANGKPLRNCFFSETDCWGKRLVPTHTYISTDLNLNVETIRNDPTLAWTARLAREFGMGAFIFWLELPESTDEKRAVLTLSRIRDNSKWLTPTRAKTDTILPRVWLTAAQRTIVEQALTDANERAEAARIAAAERAMGLDPNEPAPLPNAAGSQVATKKIAAQTGADPHYLARMIARQEERKAQDASAGTRIQIPKEAPKKNPPPAPPPPPDTPAGA